MFLPYLSLHCLSYGNQPKGDEQRGLNAFRKGESMGKMEIEIETGMT